MKKILLTGIISLIALNTVTANAVTQKNMNNKNQIYSQKQENYGILSTIEQYKEFYVEVQHSTGTTIVKKHQNINKQGFQTFAYTKKANESSLPIHDGSGDQYGFVSTVDNDTFEVATNFFIVNNKLYHSNSQTGKSTLGLAHIDGDTYYFNKNNHDPYAMTGWQTVEGHKYYFNEDGKAEKGFSIIDGETYFFTEDGKQVLGVREIDGKTYFFDNRGGSSGELFTGWGSFDSNHRFYFDPLNGGAAHEGWKYGDPAGPMYFNEYGVMQKGVTKIEQDYYLFLTNGSGKQNAFQKYGWHIDNKTGHRYYFDQSNGGAAHKGWKYGDPAGSMYFNEHGVMQKGVTKIEQDYYLFLTNGSGKNAFQKYGWYTDRHTGHRYYFDRSNGGKAAKGTTVIDGKTYYFSQEGVLQS